MYDKDAVYIDVTGGEIAKDVSIDSLVLVANAAYCYVIVSWRRYDVIAC